MKETTTRVSLRVSRFDSWTLLGAHILPQPQPEWSVVILRAALRIPCQAPQISHNQLMLMVMVTFPGLSAERMTAQNRFFHNYARLSSPACLILHERSTL